MQDYELVVIYKKKEAGTAESVKKVKDLLKLKKLKVNSEDDWGEKQLAYPIKNENSGHYVFYNITGESQDIKPVEEALRIDENLLRFRIFKFEEKKLKKAKKTKKAGDKNE